MMQRLPQAASIGDIFNIVTPPRWLQLLREVPLNCRVVQHTPSTPRYDRALQKLDYLVHEGRLLGVRQGEQVDLDVVEVALWARPAAGKGCGYYACFRLFLRDQGAANFAVLFCFYDGTDNSPCLKGFESALTFANSHHFRDDHHG